MNVEEMLGRDAATITDGAMGTYLEALGYRGGCTEEANRSAPALVRRVHEDYIRAGAEIVLSNTFGGNRYRLGRRGLAEARAELNRRGAGIAAEAGAALGVPAAGDMGPLGELLEPYGSVSEADARAAFEEQAKDLAAGGVGLIVLETFGDLRELGVAFAAAASAALPVVACLSLSAGRELRTMMGQTVADFAVWAERARPAAIGLNCGVDAAAMLPAAEEILRSTDTPLWVKPNAGMPEVSGGAAAYPETPARFAARCGAMIAAGARFAGGCCGTGPSHIEALRAVRDASPGGRRRDG